MTISQNQQPLSPQAPTKAQKEKHPATFWIKLWGAVAAVVVVLAGLAAIFPVVTGMPSIPSLISSLVNHPASPSLSTSTQVTQLSTDEKIRPVYQDPLNKQNNPTTIQEGWDTTSSNPSFRAACAFTLRGYEVSLTDGDLSVANPSFCQAKQRYGDVLVEVTVDVISGSVGLLFRDQYADNNWGYYSLDINPGERQIRATINNTDGSLPGLDWTKFPAGVPAGNTHTLQVIARGNTFSFYIDRIFFAKATDKASTYMAGGIGFVCYNPQGSKSGEALFSNVSIRNLPNET